MPGEHVEADLTYHDGGVKVWSPDGTAYTIDRRSRVRGDIKVDGRGSVQNFAWHVTRIEDRNGNWIEFDYIPRTAAQYTLIDKIRTSDGREIRFFYIDGATGEERHDTSHVLLEAVEANGQRYEYDYQPLAMDGADANEPDINVSGGYYLLNRVNGPEGLVWQYDYHLPGTEGYDADGLYSMRQVTAPFGGQTRYTYLRKSIGARSVFATDTTAIDTKTTQGADIEPGTWSYRYYLDPSDPFSFDLTEITTPAGRELYLHCGTQALAVDGGLSGGSRCNGQEGALVEKRIYAPGEQQPARRETYTWGSIAEGKVSDQFEQSPMRSYATQGVFQRVLIATTITQGANTYSTYNVDFDGFANPTWVVEIDGPPVMPGDPIPGFGERNRRDRFMQFEHLTDSWILSLPKRSEQPDLSVEGPGIDGTRNMSWVEEQTYDSKGNQLSKTVNGYTTSSTYHPDGALHTVTDPLGRITRLEDYYRNIPRLEVRADGVELRRMVLPTGLVGTETNGRGFTTTYVYDELNRIVAIDKPRADDADIELAYGFVAGVDLDQPARTLTRGGFKERIWVDGFGREILKSVDGIYLAKRYDALGRQVFLSYPSDTIPAQTGPGKQYDLDVLGRALQTTNTADGTTTRVELDLADFKQRLIDELGNVTTFTHRAYGSPDSAEVIKIESPDGPVTELSRLRSGQVLEAVQRSADGTLESFRSYVPAEDFQLDFESHPETGVTQVEFDAVGKLISSQTGTGSLVTRAYDQLDRLKTVTYADPALNTTYEYDDNSNVVSVAKGITRWAYAYDENDNLTTQTLTITAEPRASYTVSYEYDALDALKAIVLPSGMRIDYAPSPRGWPSQLSPMTDGAQGGDSVEWYPSGMLKSVQFANGTTLNYALNARNFVDQVQAITPSAAAIALNYQYDSIGNVLSLQDDSGLASFSQASYDGMNRLTSLQHASGPQTFEYDALGNLRRMRIGDFEQAYDYDASGAKLVNVTGDRQRTMTYGDPYGNITADGRHGYEYAEDGNLVRVIQNFGDDNAPNITSDFAYDAMDRRARETTTNADTSTIRHFVHDQAGMLLYEEDYRRCLTKSYIRLSRMTFGWREMRSTSDRDQDGIVDCVEFKVGLDLNDPDDAGLDLDGDGLSNLEEYLRRLAIDRADSDDDGMSDGYEVAHNLQPLENDADQDKDGDGFSNIDEMREGTDPEDPNDFYRPDPGDVVGKQTLSSPRIGSTISLAPGEILLRDDNDLVKLVDMQEMSRTPLGTVVGLARSPDDVLVAYDDFPDRIAAYNADSTELWARGDVRIPLDPAVRLHPSGLVLLCDSDERLIALELGSGEERWRRSLGHQSCEERLIVAPNGLIVVYSDRARGFMGLTAGGALAFLSEVVMPSSIVPGRDGFYVLRGRWDGNVIERRSYRTGLVIESIALDYEPQAVRTKNGGHLLVLGFHVERQQWVIEQRDPQRQVVARIESSTPFLSPIVAADDTILTGEDDGLDVFALKANGVNGAFDTIWRTTLDSAAHDLALGTDGTLYVHATGGELFAIHSGVSGLASSVWPTGSGGYLRTGVAGCPISADEDADGISDCLEQSWGFDKTDSSDGTGDVDEDGLSNANEIVLGTHPYLADSDGDLVVDGEEIAQTSDPLRADSEFDFDGDGTVAFHEALFGTSDADLTQQPEASRSRGAIESVTELSNANHIVWAIGNDGTRVSLSHMPGIGDRVHAFTPTGALLFEVPVAPSLVRTARQDQSESRVLALTETGDVLVASNDPVWHIIRIDRHLGRVSAQYRLPTHFEIAGNIVLDSDSVYVLAHDTRAGSNSSTVFAFDLRDRGNTRWVAALDDSAHFLVGGLRGEIYPVQDDAMVIALDGATGEELWRSSIVNRLRTVPSVDRDGVIYLSALPNVYALKPDGVRLWWQGPDFRSLNRSRLTDGGLLLVGRDVDDTVSYDTETGIKRTYWDSWGSFVSLWDGALLADTATALERIEEIDGNAQSVWQLPGSTSVNTLARNGDLLFRDQWIGTGALGGLSDNGWPIHAKDLRRTFSARSKANVPLRSLEIPADHPPIVLIEAPFNGDVHLSSEPLTLRAQVFDAEGTIAATSVEWTLANGTVLGLGDGIQINLPVGEHVISAAATDAGGQQSFARAAIKVERPTVNLESQADDTLYQWQPQEAAYTKLFRYPFTADGSTGRALIVNAYHIEHPDEVSVRFNGTLLGYLPVTPAGGPASIKFLLPEDLFGSRPFNAPDELVFEQHRESDAWGIGGFHIVNLGPADVIVNAHQFNADGSVIIDEYFGDFWPQGYFLPNGDPLETVVSAVENHLNKTYRIASNETDLIMWLTAIYLQTDDVAIWVDGQHLETLDPVAYWLNEESGDGLEVERRRVVIPAIHFADGYADIEFRGNPDYDDEWGVGGFRFTRAIQLLPDEVEPRLFAPPSGLAQTEQEVRFEFESDGTPLVLFIQASGVSDGSSIVVKVNNEAIGHVDPTATDEPQRMTIPGSSLINGDNHLQLVAQASQADGWRVGPIRIATEAHEPKSPHEELVPAFHWTLAMLLALALFIIGRIVGMKRP